MLPRCKENLLIRFFPIESHILKWLLSFLAIRNAVLTLVKLKHNFWEE
jgi:hypothetical protein